LHFKITPDLAAGEKVSTPLKDRDAISLSLKINTMGKAVHVTKHPEGGWQAKIDGSSKAAK
jgi:hypothetical protein